MRFSVPALALALAVACATLGPVTLATSAEAQTRRTARTVVVIQPRFLTAGTQVSPSEYRGAVPFADARFRSSGTGLSGPAGNSPYADPWHLPQSNVSFTFNGPFGSKLPGER